MGRTVFAFYQIRSLKPPLMPHGDQHNRGGMSAVCIKDVERLAVRKHSIRLNKSEKKSVHYGIKRRHRRRNRISWFVSSIFQFYFSFYALISGLISLLSPLSAFLTNNRVRGDK